ncbi:thiamine phosphate synthase [Azospirillum isscasi]|uniref:Thiamine phosphate synthase n=1 Tax=Azospirillum isscasi TaxID=3053926 RepID=A0ABU0WHX9_9PROT|nr:thiamine phosphate synthase [Azospirillum isscasi]MDQ2103766.1 thiamine phosphate synthase [Azospirillum isscasi]
MMAIPSPRLLAITDRRQAAQPLPDLAARLFAGGLRWLSLRERDLDESRQVALARALVERARPWGALVTLHGDPGLALAAGTDGVHLPDGADVAAARRRLGPGALVGLSAHDAEGISRAEAGGADYVTLSPVFPSPSKPGYGPPVGMEGLRQLAAGTSIPVIALGGVESGNVAGCLAAGATGAAVMGALMRAPDTLSDLLKALKG